MRTMAMLRVLVVAATLVAATLALNEHTGVAAATEVSSGSPEQSKKGTDTDTDTDDYEGAKDLRMFSQPTKEGRRVRDHFVVKGADGQHTELRYDMTYAEDTVPLSDYVDGDAPFQVQTLLCRASSMHVTVSDLDQALRVLAPERVVLPGDAFRCTGPARDHSAAFIESVAVADDGTVVLSVEWEHFVTAFDAVDIEFHHRPDGHDQASMIEANDMTSPRVRRATRRGCACEDECRLSIGAGLSTWCHTRDGCGESCGLLDFSCSGSWDYCTEELSGNADVVSWNYAGSGSAEVSSYELYSKSGVTVSCEDCFATINVGVTFRLRAEGRIELLELSSTATATAQATLQAQFQAGVTFEYETPPLLGDGVPGPSFILPVITIPLRTTINFRALLEMGAEATVTVSGGVSYERSVTGGISYTRGDGISPLRDVGGDGIDFSGPDIDARVHANAVLRLIPQVRLFIVERLPLAVTVSLQPYLGAEGTVSLEEVVAELFWGMDLGLETEEVSLLGFTVFDAWEDTFTLINRTPLDSVRREFARRRSIASADAHVARMSFGSCDFECPTNATCISENGAAACYCDDGFEPVRDTEAPDMCQLTEEAQLCEQVDCDAIPNAECRRGMCFCRDGFTADHRSGAAVCVRSDGRPAQDPCSNITCGAHSSCTAGQCVCNDGFHLEEFDDGFACQPTDPCSGIVCGLNAFCVRGTCHCSVGYILSRDGFNCAPHLPECGSMTDSIMDESTCFDGATCRDDDKFEGRRHCVCDDGLELRYHADGTTTCELPNLCTGYACPPGHVCEIQPVTRQPACVRVAEPCKVANGGCGLNAHCVQKDGQTGWQCACNEGHYGYPFRECVLRNPCSVDASGGCSIHAECSVGTEGERVCTCKDGYIGDGYTCVFHACERDDAPVCHEKGMCVPATKDGQATCECQQGYYGNGTHCFTNDPCAENGPCDPSSSVCVIDGEDAACACAPGHVLNHNATACNTAEVCNAAAFGLKCSENADCVIDNGNATCRCQAGYRDVGGANDPQGYRCQRIDPCVEHPDDLCPGEHMICSNSEPGRYQCRCQEGFQLSSDYECVEINPCESRYTAGCDRDAVCNHTGPGQHTCTCLPGFSGDGYTCAPLNPCLDDPSPCNTDTQVCLHTGPNKHQCACKQGFRRDDTGVCVPRNMCGVLRGGCPARSTCRMNGINDFSCVCDFGYYPTGTALFQTGVRALSSCQSARVDIVTTKRALSPSEASSLVHAAFDTHEGARGVVVANVTTETTGPARNLFRATIVVEHTDSRSSGLVAVRPLLVAEALNTTFLASEASATLVPEAPRKSPVFQGAFESRFSPYSVQSIDAVIFSQSTASGGGLSDGQVAGAVVGALLGVAVISVAIIVLVRRGAFRKVDVFDNAPTKSQQAVASSDV